MTKLNRIKEIIIQLENQGFNLEECDIQETSKLTWNGSSFIYYLKKTPLQLFTNSNTNLKPKEIAKKFSGEIPTLTIIGNDFILIKSVEDKPK